MMRALLLSTLMLAAASCSPVYAQSLAFGQRDAQKAVLAAEASTRAALNTLATTPTHSQYFVTVAELDKLKAAILALQNVTGQLNVNTMAAEQAVLASFMALLEQYKQKADVCQ